MVVMVVVLVVLVVLVVAVAAVVDGWALKAMATLCLVAALHMSWHTWISPGMTI